MPGVIIQCQRPALNRIAAFVLIATVLLIVFVLGSDKSKLLPIISTVLCCFALLKIYGVYRDNGGLGV